MTDRRVVVLGMMAKVPVPGIIWQTVQYLVGLRRLGLKPYYVEAHRRTPAMLMTGPDDDGCARAATFLADQLGRFDFGDRWVYVGQQRSFGLGERELRRLYREAELVLNLHGATPPAAEHALGGRLVYLETDPVQLQVELHDGVESTYEVLDAHDAFFTFAENLGGADCGLPVSDRFRFKPTRQPILIDVWSQAAAAVPEPKLFTTVGNWRQPHRAVELDGRTLGWTKDDQWRKFIDLPRRTPQPFELALSGTQPHNVEALRSRGWRTQEALDFGTDIDAYRGYIGGSRGEFTVAKEQNVALRTGWFSDRSAAYLAAGRPVVTQDTGFGAVLPVGEGLFAVADAEAAADAVEEINSDYARHSHAAAEIAREHFAAKRVLGALCEELGVETGSRPAAVKKAPKHRPLGPDSTVLALIPHFKCEEWLDDCLESLVNQTRPPDAIVVIDDASDEPPLATVRRYDNVTLLHAERNVGPYRLVQQVIEETGYDAYMFQDADDWSAAERLERLLAAAAETGAELIGTHEIRVFCAEPEIVPVAWPLDIEAQFAEKPTAFPLLHPTSIVSRELVTRLGGFASGLRFSGDAEFLRRARFVAKVANVPDHLYFRRIRAGSLTTAPETGLQSPERKRVMEMLWARARENAECVEQRRAPDLTPIERAPSVGLRHLAGPALLPANTARRERSDPLPRPAQTSPSSASPVFVVGAERSGVSTLAAALGEHPGIAYVPDGSWLAELSDDDLAGAAALLGRLGSRFVDGSWQHTHAIPPLAEAFPGARFIHLLRDADTAIEVTVEPPLGAAGATGGTQIPKRLRAKVGEREAAERWTCATEACIRAVVELGPERVLRVSFDDLIAEPERVVRACLEFAGEPFRHECLRPLRGLSSRPAPEVPRGSESTRAAVACAAARALSRELRGEAAADAPRERSGVHTRALLERVAAGSSVAIASRGDEGLLSLDGVRARHFPELPDGRWVGHHPADSGAAIRALRDSQHRGADHLLIPSTSLWWLDHYVGLRRHLEDEHEQLAHGDEGALFRLSPPPPGRVVMVTDHFPKFSETFFMHEFLGLLERGWDVHVLCNRSNRDQWDYFPRIRDELRASGRIQVVKDFDAQLAELQPDVIHFGYGTLARDRLQAGRLGDARVVVSFRGYDINYFGLEDRRCYEEVWERADVLHLVSEDVWVRAQRRGCPPDKPHRVITDAVDVGTFSPPERRSGPRGSEDDPLRLLGVGRLHWKKGYEYALSALRTLLDLGVAARLRIAGDGPQREPVLFAVHDLGLEDHVELLGACTADQVRDQLAWADAVVHPAVSEGFCVSVIEAQAMGLPVVCSDADGLSQNVDDGITGFVVARRDDGAIAERLARLAADGELRLRMGAAARARAEEHFDFERQLDGLEGLYKAVLGSASPRAAPDPRTSALEGELAALECTREALECKLAARTAINRVRAFAASLPHGSNVLVVSRGDEELVDLDGVVGMHFPQVEDGRYAGQHPADGAEAVRMLEALRAKGAEYLVVPATSGWWLEHYSELRELLESRCAKVGEEDGGFVAFALAGARKRTARVPDAA